MGANKNVYITIYMIGAIMIKYMIYDVCEYMMICICVYIYAYVHVYMYDDM